MNCTFPVWLSVPILRADILPRHLCLQHRALFASTLTTHQALDRALCSPADAFSLELLKMHVLSYPNKA